ncbi:MAG TPA: hypothetical protein VIJ94_19470 [Caulobacteraceae bacterium]
MPALQRSVSQRGARFYQDGEQIMFVRHLDASTREGPRAATEADRAAHPDAWAAFEAERPLPQARAKAR